jgi:hypothetical protein
MRRFFPRLAVCLVALLSLTGVARVEDEREAKKESDRFEKELSRRIQGKAALEDVRIDVRWPIVDHVASFRLYGRGILICDGKAQSTVSKDAVRSTLKTLRDGRFADMEDHYGSLGEDEEAEEERERQRQRHEPVEQKPNEGPALKGFVDVRLGALVKTSQQFAVGDQSAELEALVRKLLPVCRGGANGISASSLDDGVQKVASGALAPETFALILNRRSESKAGDDRESFILEMQGRRVTDRLMPPGQTPPAPRSLDLPEADYTALVRVLADQHVGEIPINVYADRYTELRVTVLDRERSIVARKFLNMTPQTHGEKQQAFDRAYAALQLLHARVAKEGKTVVPPASAPAAKKDKEREKEKD